jgi:hypothetical protein
MREQRQRIGRRPAAYQPPPEYPKILYHCRTGQMRKVYSTEEEVSAGPEWGAAQTDLRQSRKPMIDDGRTSFEIPYEPIEQQGTGK